MEHASQWPVLLATKHEGFGRGGLQFLDLTTLQPIELMAPNPNGRGLPGDGAFLNASADGRVFCMRNGVGGEPHTVTCVQLQASGGKAPGMWGVSGSVLVPAPDGRFIYASSGVYTPGMNRLCPDTPQTSFSKPVVPAHHGSYFMQLDSRAWDQFGGSLQFFLSGKHKPFAQLAGVEGVTNEQISYGTNRDTLTHAERVHF